jgi:hypothetical protein
MRKIKFIAFFVPFAFFVLSCRRSLESEALT